MKFRTLALLAVTLFLLVIPILSGDPTVESMAITVLLLAGAAVAWNIFSGYTGYISLGSATYYGIGAYVLALGMQDWHISGGFGSFLLLPVAGLVTGAISVPLGWLALRTRRSTFMVITIAFFFIFQSLAYNLQGLTGGSEGIFLPIPDWGSDLLPFYVAASIVLLLGTLASWRVRHSKFGLLLLAIRDDEERAQGLGIPNAKYKLGAYVLSAVLTGIVGALSIFYVGIVNPTTAFDQSLNLTVITVSFLGGIGTVFGPIVGGVLLLPIQTFIQQQFGVGATGLNQIIFGGLLLAVILFLPEGIVPSLQKGWPVVWNTLPGVLVRSQASKARSPSWATAVSPGVPTNLDSIDVHEPVVPVVSPEQKEHVMNNGIWDLPPLSNQQSLMLRPSMGISLRVKAQRLQPLTPSEAMVTPAPTSITSSISWRCPYCRRPFLLRGNICYCPRCGFTRSLVLEEQHSTREPEPR